MILIQVGSILHAQLEIWKAAFIDASCIDNNILTSSTAGPSGAAALTMPQTSLWNQMMNDDSEVSEGEFAI